MRNDTYMDILDELLQARDAMHVLFNNKNKGRITEEDYILNKKILSKEIKRLTKELMQYESCN